MADEPIADVVARVLAFDELGLSGTPRRADCVTLARAVARLTEEKGSLQLRLNVAGDEIGQLRAEVARLTGERDAAGWVAAEAEEMVTRLRETLATVSASRDYWEAKAREHWVEEGQTPGG